MGPVTMMNGGFFAHRDLSLDAPLFRCLKLRHIPDLFENARLYFHNATRWEDTWEIPSQFFELKNENRFAYIIEDANRLSSEMYGTCWTDTVDSDALWRIYSGKEKEGICIQTTVRKLFQSIDFSFRSKYFVDGFIAPVRYEQLDSAQGGQVFFDDDSECYPRNMVSAFVKRKAFKHEREIRFLIHAPQHKLHYPHNPLSITEDESGMYLPFMNLDFIECLIADPRLSANEFDALKKRLECYGKDVVKSLLYETPEKIYEIILNSGCQRHNMLKDAFFWNCSEFTQPFAQKNFEE